MMIGQALGKYQLQAEIGRGGMGIVYRGYDPALRRPVAIKLLPQQLTYDSQFVQRFQQEAILAASLRHPGIVTIHDVGEQAGVYYIVMEYLEGTTLEALLARQGALTPTQAARIVRQLADALDYAHGRGVIHRDIKPANIMVSPEGRATLMDFGLVRAAEGTSLTRSGVVMGTPEYMSPEQALGEPVDGRSDVYSLGIVLYKMLSGKVPFSRSTPYAITYAHIHEPPPPLRQARADLPASMEAVVDRTLAKRPAERYGRAGLLADDLEAAVGGRPPVAAVGRSGEPTVQLAGGKRGQPAPVAAGRLPSWTWLTGAAVLLLAVVAVIWTLTRSSGGAPTQRNVLTPVVAIASTAPAGRTADLPTWTPEATPTRPPTSAPTQTFAPTPTIPAATQTSAATATVVPPSATPIPNPRFTANQVVNVRQGPGTNYAVVGELAVGLVFDITGRNAAGDWLQFSFNGRPAWVKADLVSVSGDAGQIAVAQNIPPPPTLTPVPAQCGLSPGPSFARFWDRNRIGCPTGNEFALWTAYETFERGWMLWRQDNNRHYALFSDGAYVFYWYPPAEPADFACAEAAQLGRPRRGFSRVWCENPSVRQRIGNALSDEVGNDWPVQEFENGFMIYVKARGTVATVLNDGTWQEQR
jgi:hypothetical protein